MRRCIRNNSQGVTLVEIMMVVAVMGVLFLGVFSLINKVTKGTWRIGGTLGMTSAASEAMYWIGNDFRNAKVSSIGNLGPNPGFEEPIQAEVSPTGWDNIVPNSLIAKIGPTEPNIKNGFVSIKLSSYATAYFSNIITIPAARDYIISGWAKGNNITANIGLVKGDETEFIPAITKSNNQNYYVHLTSYVFLNLGQTARLKLSEPDSIWNFDYDTTQPVVWDFCVFKGKLYAGTGQGGRIYVKDKSNPWALAATLGVFRVYSFCVYNDRLYAGTYNPARIYVSDDGITWNIDYTPPAGTVTVFYTLCEYNGRLFAGTSGLPGPISRIFVYDGVGWTEVMTLPETSIFHLCVYRDKLFAGTYADDKIYVHEGNDPTVNWNIAYDVVAVNSWAVKRLCVFKDVLYAGTYAGGNIFYHTGDVPTANWNIAYTKPGGLPNDFIMSMGVYRDNLFMGTQQEGRIYRHGGDIPTLNWNLDFDSPELSIESFGVYEDKLYAGGLSMGRIYVLGGASYFDDAAISPVEVIFSSSTTVSTDTDYEYYTSKGASDSEYTRFKRYRLHYDRPARKLYRQVYRGPGPNDWENSGPDPLCENVSRLTITNQNQESFDVELILEKVIDASQTKEYRVKSRFTPAVP